MSDSPKRTIIEDGTEFDGSVTSQCGVTVSGSIKGSLDAPDLDVTSTGAVHGQITVSDLKSHGEISGQVEAETAELSGRVGNDTTIRAASLEVKLDRSDKGMQVTFGNCELRVGEGSANRRTEKAAAEREEVPVQSEKTEPVL